VIIEKRAAKLVINLKKISYTNRLQRLKLPTLKYRRLHRDMIEVFNAFKGCLNKIRETRMGFFMD